MVSKSFSVIGIKLILLMFQYDTVIIEIFQAFLWVNFSVDNLFHEQDDARLLQGCACKSSWHKDVMGACARSKMTSSQKLGKANIVIIGSVSVRICLFLCLSLSVSLCLSLFVCLSLSLSLFLCLSLSVSLCFSL
jgi:hypothetical protein